MAQPKVISREKAQAIAMKCKVRGSPCPLCWEQGSDEPSVCCAFCAEFGRKSCNAPPCKLVLKEDK